MFQFNRAFSGLDYSKWHTGSSSASLEYRRHGCLSCMPQQYLVDTTATLEWPAVRGCNVLNFH